MKNQLIIGFTLITLFTLVNTNTYAQSFVGTVLDKETKQPIPFAEVYFVDLKTGTTTDNQGIFKIEHYQQDKIHIQISYVGYTTLDKILSLSHTSYNTIYLEQTHFNLKEVIVSVPSGKLQGQNIVNVTAKKIKQLEETAPITLAEAISNIPGVAQNTTGAGIGKPIIRGLSGSRIVTYAQGVRVENQQWGDEHGLGVGEVGIEGVEVIKGPASILYGSDALGGVLYFIDERYAKHNTIDGFVSTKFLSNTSGLTNNVGVKMHKNNVKFNLFGAYSSQADYKTPKFGRILNTRFDEKNIKGSLGFNTKNWIVDIRYSYLQNNYGIAEDATYTKATKRKFELPFQTINNHALSLENTIFLGKSKLDLTVGLTNNYRREFEDSRLEQALGLKLRTYTYNFKWHSPTFSNKFNVVMGTQGMAQRNKNNGAEILIPNASTTDFGVFALGNLDYTKLHLQGGIRTDIRHIKSEQITDGGSEFPALDKTYNGLTFSAGALYKLEKIKYRFDISSGFRAPNTSELLADGVHEGTNRYEKGNSNLKNESAVQADFSFAYESPHFSVVINPFYNMIKRYIFLSPTALTIDSNPVFEYLQTDAQLYGGEVGFHYHPHAIHWLHIENTFSLVRAQDTNKNPLPLIPQTNINTTVRADISHAGRMHLKNVFIQNIYKFKQNRNAQFETITGNYNLINIGAAFEIASKNMPIDINVGVKNLLNTQYIDHLSRFKKLEIPNQGINFYLTLKLSLSRNLSPDK